MKLSIRLGRSVGTARQRYMIGSAVVHLVMLIALVWGPELWPRSTRVIGPSINARLVQGIPGPPAPKAEAVQTPRPLKPQPKPQPPPPKPKPKDTLGEDVVPTRRETKKSETKPDPAPQPVEAPQTTGQPDESAGGTSPGTGGNGAQVSAAGIDAEFDWYASSITAKLYQNWRRPTLSGMRQTLQVRVSFTILRDGRVASGSLQVEESSGIPAMDRSALRAVAEASPMPRPPADWPRPTVEASYTFQLLPEDF